MREFLLSDAKTEKRRFPVDIRPISGYHKRDNNVR